jgi:xylan 1,4-beta-xylosidase
VKKIALCLALLFTLAAASIPEYSYGQTPSTFTNPIIAGFYPDPSICRVGKDYYLVNSTFAYFPGINVFHSTDLVHWKLIGYVLNRPQKFNLDGQQVSRGLFAPAIRYHNGLFYVTCTLVDIGGNFVATAKDPGGPWSDPAWLPQLNGIDPSLFFDDDGKAYIVYNSIPPDDKTLYPGHRTIRVYEFDPDSLKVKGDNKILVNGGTDIAKKPRWIEGPHILKKDGMYFLIAAEGGTEDRHSEVVFKSAGVYGPYIPFEKNPILTQRSLNPQRPNPITSTGHADLVQTESGEWWAVFLGCRPYHSFGREYYNTGRETFLAPVTWENGWPVINPGHEEVQYRYPSPIPASTDSADMPRSGNFRTRDDFDSPALSPNWVFLRTPHDQWFDLSTKKGSVTLKLRPETCSGNMNPSFLGRRQEHLRCSASAGLLFTPRAENEKAGLVVFQNENHFYFICKSLEKTGEAIQVYSSDSSSKSAGGMLLIASSPIGKDDAGKEVMLKIDAKEDCYSCSFALDASHWTVVQDSMDAKFLSTQVAGGFVGCMFAMYATSDKEASTNIASYDWFEYSGVDTVYK